MRMNYLLDLFSSLTGGTAYLQVSQSFGNEDESAAEAESRNSSFRMNMVNASPKVGPQLKPYSQTFRGAGSFSRSMKRALSQKEMGSSDNFKTHRIEPFLLSPSEIRSALETLEVQRLNQFEFDEMFEEAISYMKSCTIEHSDFRLLETINGDGERLNYSEIEQPCLPLPFLIAGSEAFRQKLLKLETDPIFCTLMTSNLSSFISSEQMRILAKGGNERELSRIGVKIFTSKADDDSRRWFFILSGKLKVSLDSSLPFNEETETETFEIGAGEYFGGYGIEKHEPGWSHIVVETLEVSKILELQGSCLDLFYNKHQGTAKKLLARMGGESKLDSKESVLKYTPRLV
jgi:hypothetical protein